jgi:putative heme-binding domain-containing protein
MHRKASLLVIAVTLLSAQEESSQRMSNPFTAPEDIAAGALTFLSQCASCHGRDGRGGQGTPDLTAGTFRRASSDEGLFSLIAKGIPGTTMPGFNLSGREIWQTLAYVRSLSTGVRSAELAKGNATKGAELFHSAGCEKCHQPRGVGPDLRAVVHQRSLSDLRQSVLDPNAEVAPDYWRIRGQAISGRAIEGLRLNEDTHTIQYRDSAGRLRSVAKSDIAKYEIVRTSPMPSFQGKLTPDQIEDILAFLTGGIR